MSQSCLLAEPRRTPAAVLGGNSRRGESFLDACVCQVEDLARRGRLWGWDGASLQLTPECSEDPIGINSGDVNFYRYCGNDPVNWIDPSGLFWAETWAGIKGLGQGACNIGNGLQDTVIGIANLPATAVNGIAWAEEKVGILPEGSIRAPYIPSPDWSRDLVTKESGTGWADSHNWSKGLGAGGVELATGAWIGKASKARQAAGLVDDVAKEVAEQAAKKTANAAISKGQKFFQGFKTGINQQTRQVGRFTEFSVDVPGRVSGSFTRWVKVVDENGKTIRLYHDTFDKTGKFIHRGIKVPGPERHVP